jgi:hypothetical protein
MAWVFVLCGSFASCGYHFQGRDNPWEKDGVSKVYVDSFVNRSSRAGAETVFTSALVKVFARGERLRVVQNKKDADAVLEGVVTELAVVPVSAATVTQLTKDPAAKPLADISLATEYAVNAIISVNLVRSKDSKSLWMQSFSGSKIFPGNNRFGTAGSTSVLINDSQQNAALSEIAFVVATDAYDFMLETF